MARIAGSTEAPRGRRRNAASKGTREIILQAAERLFAERGIQAVSLREIAAVAGQANSSAVQYHFQSKERLIHELLWYRVEQMEEPRRRMLAEANTRGLLGDTKTLLEIVCLPQLEARGENGRHYFCAFLSQYLGHYQLAGYPHPVEDTKADLAIRQVNHLLRKGVVSHLPAAIAEYRIVLSNMMFLNMVVRYELSRPGSRSAVELRVLVDDTLECMVAALCSPGFSAETLRQPLRGRRRRSSR
jgi:AcrR family transcriptional regulator